MNLGNLLKDMGQLDEAISACRQAVVLQPNWAEAHYNLGTALQAQGKWDEAITAFGQAIALKPHYPEAYNNLGIALQIIRQQEQAIAAYRQAIALQPGYAHALSNLGTALQAMKKPNEAIDAYRQAIAVQPDYPEAYYNLGICLKIVGQLDDALAAYRQAIALKPGYAEAYRNLGDALQTMGRRQEAIAAFQEALRLKPDDEDTRFSLVVMTGNQKTRTVPAAVVRSLFDVYAYNFDKHLVEQLGYRIPEKIFHAVRSIDLREDWDILDLGCGTGLCGALFRPHAHRLVGVDYRRACLNALRSETAMMNSSKLTLLRRCTPARDNGICYWPPMYSYTWVRWMKCFRLRVWPCGPVACLHFRWRSMVAKASFTPRRPICTLVELCPRPAHRNSLTEVTVQATTIRREGTKDVDGWIVILGKPR